uniref:Uncharacterized protein n=1 Tax=Arundo donax TaxID=35708 RepID=A0A0A9FXD4_ARUDO
MLGNHLMATFFFLMMLLISMALFGTASDCGFWRILHKL